MSVIVYGITNCDSIRKARKWLSQEGFNYQFHDVRKDGLDAGRLDAWIQAVSWQTLLNKSGMKWRQLDEIDKQQICASSARKIMLAEPAIIKRPVLELGNKVLVGFNAEIWLNELNNNLLNH